MDCAAKSKGPKFEISCAAGLLLKIVPVLPRTTPCKDSPVISQAPSPKCHSRWRNDASQSSIAQGCAALVFSSTSDCSRCRTEVCDCEWLRAGFSLCLHQELEKANQFGLCQSLR